MADVIPVDDDPSDDAPAPVAAPPAEPPAPAETPAPDPIAALEAASEEDLKKLDPNGLLAALKAERAEKKALKETAQKAQALEQEIAQARPYVQFLQAHPELLQPRPADPVPTAPSVDPEAVQYAKEFDLYTPEGKPDIEKAQRLLKFHDDRASRKAREAVQPIEALTDQQLSAAMFHQVANMPAPNGQKVDADALKQLWASVPARLSKDPGVAALLHAAAAGFTRTPATVAAPAAPPVVTEAAGKVPTRTLSISALDKAVAAHKGMDETEFANLTKGFVKGRTYQLED